MENDLEERLAELAQELLNRIHRIDERLKQKCPSFRSLPRVAHRFSKKLVHLDISTDEQDSQDFLQGERSLLDSQQQRLSERFPGIESTLLKRHKSIDTLTDSTGLLSPSNLHDRKFMFPTLDEQRKKRRNTALAYPQPKINASDEDTWQDYPALPTVRSELECSYSDGEDDPCLGLRRSLKSELKELSPSQEVQLSPSINAGDNSERSLPSEGQGQSEPTASFPSIRSMNEQTLNVPSSEEYMQAYLNQQKESTSFKYPASLLARVIGKIERRAAEAQSQTSRSNNSGRDMSDRELTKLAMLQVKMRDSLLGRVHKFNPAQHP